MLRLVLLVPVINRRDKKPHTAAAAAAAAAKPANDLIYLDDYNWVLRYERLNM